MPTKKEEAILVEQLAELPASKIDSIFDKIKAEKAKVQQEEVSKIQETLKKSAPKLLEEFTTLASTGPEEVIVPFKLEGTITIKRTIWDFGYDTYMDEAIYGDDIDNIKIKYEKSARIHYKGNKIIKEVISNCDFYDYPTADLIEDLLQKPRSQFIDKTNKLWNKVKTFAKKQGFQRDTVIKLILGDVK